MKLLDSSKHGSFFYLKNIFFRYVRNAVFSTSIDSIVSKTITSICTADLLGFLFYVPCITEELLTLEHGEWQREIQTSQFVWTNSSQNVREDGEYTAEQMRQKRPAGTKWLLDLIGVFVRGYSTISE
ncbi:hypothetical protein PENTCL1PPCAC_14687, partial [Pristionchus entomophagus]